MGEGIRCSTSVSIWGEPAPMEAGSPEPVVLREGETAWVAYLARDPGFPGWEHPSATDYLEQHPGESFGVLRFDGVVDLALGPPSDERLHEHPLHALGLKHYSFHQVPSSSAGPDRWIVTFHDQTLDVRAATAHAFPPRFAMTAEEAIASTRRISAGTGSIPAEGKTSVPRREAAMLANRVAPEGGAIDDARCRETREGWYFPYRWDDGGPRAGSNGVIVNKRTGACFVLGSAYPVERDLVAYDEGFQFSRADLTITALRSQDEALDAIEALGLTTVTPESAHGVEWRIPRRLTRDELRARLSRLPCTFADVPLYFNVEVLQRARRAGTFEFSLSEHK